MSLKEKYKNKWKLIWKKTTKKCQKCYISKYHYPSFKTIVYEHIN